MNKKLLLIFTLAVFMLIPLASAGLFQSNKVFDRHHKLDLDQKKFLKEQEIEDFKEYGRYEIHDSKFLGLFRGDLTQDFVLLSSGNSIINAYAILEITNYRPETLLDTLKFKGGTPRDIKYSYYVTENKQVKVIDYKKVCSLPKLRYTKLKTNSTNSTKTKTCKQVKNGFHYKTETNSYWKPYTKQVMPKGIYKFKIEGKLETVNKKTDWILSKGKYDLDKWTWWNNSWDFKREISNLTGTMSALYSVDYDPNMNTDFSDVRFSDFATESTELNYGVVGYTGGLREGLMSYYKLDETSGTVATDSIGNHDGTNNGATVGATGKIGTSYSFDGASSYVDIGIIDQPGNISLSLWITMSSTVTSGSHTLISNYDSAGSRVQYMLRIDPGTDILKYIINAGTQTEYSIPFNLNDNIYHFITSTMSGNTLKIYVDGVLQNTFTAIARPTTGFGKTSIGRAGDYSTSLQYNGKIDEVAIYNKVLNSTQISEIYNSASGLSLQNYNADSVKYRLDNNNQTSVMMYYGNVNATTTESLSDTYFTPVSMYTFDNGNANDDVGTNDGTVSGATLTTDYLTGLSNSAYSFDGVNDYISGTPIFTNKYISINSWFNGDLYSSGADIYGGIFNGDRSGDMKYSLRRYSNLDKIQAIVRDTGGTYYSIETSSTPIDGTWHMATMIIDGTNLILYIDATEVGRVAFTETMTIDASQIGVHAGTLEWKGKLDEVAIYNKVLNSTQISKLYEQTAPSFITGAEQTANSLAINQNSPIDTFNSSNTSVAFDCNATDETGVLSLNLTINGTVYNTVTGNGSTNLTLTSTEVLSDNYYEWYCTANDDTKTKNTTTRTLTVDTTSPTIAVTSPVSENFIINGDTLNLNWTTSDTNPDSCWYNYNSANTTVTCSTNTTTFNYVANDNTVTFYANDTFGNLNSNVTSLVYKIIENNRTISSSTYETSLETFAIDIIANSTLDSVTLDYNGTDYTTTQSGNSYSKTFDIPSSNLGNNSIKWKFNYGSEVINSTTSYQDVALTFFTLCNATYTDDYLNFSFKDEATLTAINATVPTSTFDYYLGSGTQIKSTTYSSTSLAYVYNFCATPSLPLTVDTYFQYKQGTEYPQRIYDPDILTYTSSLTNQTLYLLNSIDGIYVTFQVITAAQQKISGVDVTVTRTIDGQDVVVGHSTTDSAGAVTFWLNPDFKHTFIFSKAGYETYTTTFAPTQSAYTLTLTGTTTISSDCSREVINKITPSDTYIDQNTNYNFIYTISSTYSTLDSFTASLYYGDNTLINTKSSTSGTGGALTFSSINTTNQSSMYMTYSYDINSSTCYSNAKTWIIQSTEGRQFSITRLLTDVGLYTSANVLGIKGESGTDNFSQVLIAFFTLISIAGFVSSRYGIRSEMFIMVMTLGFIVMFSITGIIPQIQIGQNTLSIYFLPIVTLLMLLAYALKEDLFR